jgi:hypothetical protein
MLTMKRALRFWFLLGLTACATGPATKHHRPFASVAQPNVSAGMLVLANSDTNPPRANGVGIANVAGTLTQINPDGTSSTIGGGGAVTSASLPLLITAGNLTVNAATQSLPGSLSAADKTKLDGLTTSTWAATELARAQTLLGTTLTAYITGSGLDFVAGAVNSGGTVTYSNLGVKVSTTATSARVGQATPIRSSGAFMPPTTAAGKFYASAHCKVVTAIDAAAAMRIGLGDGTDAVNIFGDGSTSTTTWHIQGTRGGSAFNTLATGGQATIDTAAYHNYRVSGDGSTYFFDIDSVSLGTSAAISAGTNAATFFQIVTVNATTSANREIDCDAYLMAWVPNT